MKKVLERFELSQVDIQEAITFWLNKHQVAGGPADFNVSFSYDEEADCKDAIFAIAQRL
jgi:hypothetical protein